MSNEKPTLRSEETLKNLLMVAEQPLSLDIVEVEYLPDADRFLTTFALGGLFDFQTLINIDKLSLLIDALSAIRSKKITS